jgi:hypothetical protein
MLPVRAALVAGGGSWSMNYIICSASSAPLRNAQTVPASGHLIHCATARLHSPRGSQVEASAVLDGTVAVAQAAPEIGDQVR